MLNPLIMLQKNIPWLKERMGDSPDEIAFVRWKLHTTLSEAGFDNIEDQTLRLAPSQNSQKSHPVDSLPRVLS